MDGTPQLLTDVKFSQVRKGYDPDEVDNFLERVSAAVAQLQDKLRQATDRAETADHQIAEARRLQAEAEAAAEKARADAGSAAPDGPRPNADEEVAKVLVLAQRAADQAVEEANATATKTVSDARAKAVNLLAEAEQERDRLLAKARKKADSVAEERAAELQKQVGALESARDDLQADLDALQHHLDGERARLQERIEAINRLLEDPQGFRLAEGPELREPEIPDLTPLELDEPDEEPFAAAGSGPFGATTGGDATAGDDDEPSPRAGSGPEASTGAGDRSGAAVTAQAGGVATMTTAAPAEAAPASGESGDTIDLTSQRLFGSEPVDAEVDDARTELFDPTAPASDPTPSGSVTAPPPPSSPTHGRGADDSPLGEPDEAADAAMRAFFERDLDEPDSSGRSRFGRRR